MKKCLLLLSFPALALMNACSCSGESVDECQDTQCKDRVVEVAARDSSVYEMGRRHAAYIINTHTEVDSIGAALLEVRAREHQIRQRIDNQAADVYIYGFERYISENAPALADSIL